MLIARPSLPFVIPVPAALPSDEVVGEVELSPEELDRWRGELAATVLELADQT